jgi:hypothetical protein
MQDLTPDPGSYTSNLNALAVVRPLIAERLIEADRHRSDRLRTYLPGKRLAGLEQLYGYLHRLEAEYAAHDELSSLVFLVQRSTRDFETALEATLSAYQGVAADAMRDVMEIEYLFLDFAFHDNHQEEWLACDRGLRLRKYNPAKLRERLSAAGVSPFANEGWEPLDYRGHSESLHVMPHVPFVGARGIEPHPDSLFADVGFIEIFEHAGRFIEAAEILRHVRLGRSPNDFEALAPLDEFRDAQDRTREMLVMSMAMHQGPRVLAERLGREPTPAEVLRFVAEETKAKSPRAE